MQLFFQNLHDLLHINLFFTYSALFFLGICIGSFYNVVVYRYPLQIMRENLNSIAEFLSEENIQQHPDFANKLKEVNDKPMNIAFPASHCFKCNHQIRWYENVPLISYLFLRGKCSNCKTHISLQYPFLELLTGLLVVGSFFLFGHNIFYPLIFVFLLLTWALTLIDFKTMLLPDSLNYTVLWMGLIAAAFSIHPFSLTLQESVLAAAAGYLSFFALSTIGRFLKKQEVMGQGDLKLLAALGAFVGLKGCLFVIFFSPFIGIVTWLALLIYAKIKNMPGSNTLPYGPSLVFASWVYFVYGKELMSMLP